MLTEERRSLILQRLRTHGRVPVTVGAGEVVALADHDTLGTAMAFVVAPMDAVTHLVTDAPAGDATLTPYRALGIEVLSV